MTTPAYGAQAADRPLEPLAIERTPGPQDVQIEEGHANAMDRTRGGLAWQRGRSLLANG